MVGKTQYKVLALSSLLVMSFSVSGVKNVLAQDNPFGDLNVSMPSESTLQEPRPVAAQPQANAAEAMQSPDIDDIMLDVESLDEELEPIDMELEPVDMATSQADLEAEIRREAFDAAITGLFPLQPDQIRQVLRQYDATEDAVKSPIFGMPTPKNSVKTVSLDPGVDPISINTAHGFVTTLNFLDVTGSPWPIGWVSFAGNFEVSPPEEGGYSVRIMPLDKYAFGNIVIRFIGLKTPVVFTLKASQTDVDYRIDMRLPEYGPFAKASIIEGSSGSTFAAGDTKVTAVLDGTPPSGAQKLSVSGVDGRTSAYNLGGSTYIRTPLTLLSPGWKSSASSADGMNVYVLNETPVLLLSDNGKFFRAHLKEAEDLFDE